jgi:hypothetical protein
MGRRDATKRPPAGAARPADAQGVAALLAPLWQASPSDFVAVRAQVVAELKAAGHAADAARVRKLRRPVPSVWATNALACAQPNAIAALLTLGERVRADEAAMLAGGDGRGFIDEARALRQQAAQLSRRAEAIAKDAGVVLNAAAARRIAQTLQVAAAGDEAARAALAAGQLDADLAAPSAFGGGDSGSEWSPSDSGDHRLSATLAASVGAPAGRREVGHGPTPRGAARRAAHHTDDHVAHASAAAGLGHDDGPHRTTTAGQGHDDLAHRRAAAGIPRADRTSGAPRADAATRGHGHARGKPGAGRDAKSRDDVSDRTRAASAVRAEVAARKQAGAAARADVTARRKADSDAARAQAAAQRRAEAVARKRAAADRRRLAAAEREVAARRREVERARAAVGAAENRLRAAKDALAAAETTAESARRRAAD